MNIYNIRLFFSIVTTLLCFGKVFANENSYSSAAEKPFTEFKVNPDLPYWLTNQKDAPCFGYENIIYDSCNNRGKYHIGYGLEALSSKFLSTYLSSYDINTSYVCFRHNDSKLFLKNISLLAYSKLDIPKKIAIYGIEKKGNLEKEIFLGNKSIDQFYESSGYFLLTINLNLIKSYDRYLVRLIEGGGRID